MTSKDTYKVISGKKEAAGYTRVLAHSYGRKEEDSAKWLARTPESMIRVLKDASGNVTAGAILIPMGQFFGGCSVPMVGIQAVGVAPEARGQGAATDLMRRVILECHADGTPISALYPATQELYRRVGYEQAGHRCSFKLPLSLIGARDRTLEVLPIEASDRDEIRALYRAFAQEHEGTLDRTDHIWNRIELPPPSREDPARAFKVIAPAKRTKKPGIEGYVFLSQQAVEGGRHDVHVHDMVALTERAGRRLWSFLASYSSIANDMHWFCGPSHPMLALLNEQPYKLNFHHFWMVRICGVKKALEARGYSKTLSGELLLTVEDPIVRPNNGTWCVSVAGGKAEATKARAKPAGNELKLSIRALASLFSGFYSASHLRRIGWLTGSDNAIGIADGLFALRTAWMSDMF